MTRWYWLALNARRATRGWMLRHRAVPGQAIVELALILAVAAPLVLLAVAVGYTVWEDALTVSATAHIADEAARNPAIAPDDSQAQDELVRAGCASSSWSLSWPDGDQASGHRAEIHATCDFPSVLGGSGEVSATRTAVIP